MIRFGAAVASRLGSSYIRTSFHPASSVRLFTNVQNQLQIYPNTLLATRDLSTTDSGDNEQFNEGVNLLGVANELVEIPLGELTSEDIKVVVDVMKSFSVTTPSRDIAVAAESLLKRVVEENASGNKVMKGTNSLYYWSIKTWARTSTSDSSEATQKTEELLRLLEKDGDMESLQPGSYIHTLIAISNSSEYGKAVKAQKILHKMDEAYRNGYDNFRLNPSPYNIVLQVCTRTAPRDDDERKETLKVAVKTIEELMGSIFCEPDEQSYMRYFKAVKNLSSSIYEQMKYAEGAFKKICQFGHLNTNVLGAFLSLAPEELRLKVLGPKYGFGNINIEDLPKFWRRNANSIQKRYNVRKPPNRGGQDG